MSISTNDCPDYTSSSLIHPRDILWVSRIRKHDDNRKFSQYLHRKYPDQLDRREQLYRDILSGQELALGELDIATIESRFAFGEFLLENRPEQERQGKGLLATGLSQVKRVPQVPGAYSFSIILSLLRLGDVHVKVEETDNAAHTPRSLYQMSSETFGKKSEATTGIQFSVALKLYNLDHCEESMRLMKDLCEIQREISRSSDITTLKSLHILSIMYKVAGEYEELIQLTREITPYQRVVLGEDHPETMASIENLAKGLVKLGSGREREAEPLYREVLRITKQHPGCDHDDTLSRMKALADYLGNSEKRESVEEAAQIYKEVIATQKRTLSPAHEDTSEATFGLLIQVLRAVNTQ